MKQVALMMDRLCLPKGLEPENFNIIKVISMRQTTIVNKLNIHIESGDNLIVEDASAKHFQVRRHHH